MDGQKCAAWIEGTLVVLKPSSIDGFDFYFIFSTVCIVNKADLFC